MIKHWTKYLREEIAGLERVKQLFLENVKTAEKNANDWLKKFKDEERRRIETEGRLYEAGFELSRLHLENRRLKDLTAEHSLLLTELEAVRGELKAERQQVRRLEKELNRRSGKEGYFGAATPSALKINKPNAIAENKAKKGGARAGHKGYGRKVFPASEADEIINLPDLPPPCGCGGKWHVDELKEHCVIERIPERKLKKFFLKKECSCSKCGRREEVRTPGASAGALYANSMVSHLLTEHYLHGLTAGSISRREEINEGTFFNIAHRSALLLEDAFKRILHELRSCLVLHADETGWRNDGSKAYAWIFANHDFAAFLFRNTRGSAVPLEVLGKDTLELNLITDRYKGYSPLLVNRQYCYIHLLRDLEAIETDFPDEPEAIAFVSALKEHLKQAVTLHRQQLELHEYLTRATGIQAAIMEICNQEAKHPAVQNFQNIFRQNPDKLFQWVKSPDIPADNNFAERGLRPTVIARKISFGSQSDKGMHTREIMMTFLYTARTRGLDPKATLENALNILGRDPTADVTLLFGFKSESKADHRAA